MAEPEASVLASIDWMNGKQGLILGWHDYNTSISGDWADPDMARYRSRFGSRALLLQTSDGGVSWKLTMIPTHGRFTRLQVLPTGLGLALMEIEGDAVRPSLAYRIEFGQSTMRAAFSQLEPVVTDVALLPDGTALLAGIEKHGSMPRLGATRRAVILRSTDLSRWEEMELDYRAVASRMFLAPASDGSLWSATDTGMVFRLTAGR